MSLVFNSSIMPKKSSERGTPRSGRLCVCEVVIRIRSSPIQRRSRTLVSPIEAAKTLSPVVIRLTARARFSPTTMTRAIRSPLGESSTWSTAGAAP